MHSDLLVRVEHDSEGRGSHSAGREVLGELGADHATVSVAGDDLAPTALVGVTSHLVLGPPDVGNALSVVESSALAVFAAFDLQESLSFVLITLSTLEAHKARFLVESKM